MRLKMEQDAVTVAIPVIQRADIVKVWAVDGSATTTLVVYVELLKEVEVRLEKCTLPLLSVCRTRLISRRIPTNFYHLGSFSFRSE